MVFRGAKPPAENVASPSVDPTLCHFMLFPVMLHLQTHWCISGVSEPVYVLGHGTGDWRTVFDLL
jgi:hypothetical protein